MKKIIKQTNSFLLAGMVFLFVSCTKNNTVSTNSEYLNITPGSIWHYELADTSNGLGEDTMLTETSAPEDTLINGKSYHVYTHSLSSIKEYDREEGNNYYELGDHASFPVPGIISKQGTQEILYLKSDLPVGGFYILYDTAYTQNDLNPAEKFTIPIQTTYTVMEKDITKTINNINYSGVIHIFSSSSSSFFAAGMFVNTSDSYYAKKFGLIESYINFHINYTLSFDQQFHTTLLNSYIK